MKTAQPGSTGCVRMRTHVRSVRTHVRMHSTHVRTYTNHVRTHVRMHVRTHTARTCVCMRTNAYAPGTFQLSPCPVYGSRVTNSPPPTATPNTSHITEVLPKEFTQIRTAIWGGRGGVGNSFPNTLHQIRSVWFFYFRVPF